MTRSATRRTMWSALTLGVTVAVALFVLPGDGHVGHHDRGHSFTGRAGGTIQVSSTGSKSTTLPLRGVTTTAPTSRIVRGSALAAPARSIRTGATPDRTTVAVLLGVFGKDPRGLAAQVSAVSTPGSPQYRHFLPTGYVAAHYGASVPTVERLTSQLSAVGVHDVVLSPTRTYVTIHALARTVEHVFGVRLYDYTLADGARGYQAVGAPTLSGSFSQSVASIGGITTLTRLHHVGTPSAPKAGPLASESTCPSAATYSLGGGQTAQQQLSAYGLLSTVNSGTDGTGKTLALFELEPYTKTDVAAYKTCYGLSNAVTSINVDGGVTGSGGLESTLDIEEAASLAPGASIAVYQGPNAGNGPVDVMARIAADNTADVVSTSWGVCEAYLGGDGPVEATIFQQMALQGQTIFAASGDSGSSDCAHAKQHVEAAVDDPASQPYVTGVGGTTLRSLSPTVETVWNDGTDSGGGATGGGYSSLWARPAWQVSPNLSSAHRAVPDVAAFGDPQTSAIVYYNGAWVLVGGTSAAAPLWGSVAAVSSQHCNSRLGFLNPLLYKIAADPDTSAALYDVTSGTNLLYSGGTSFAASVGYDEASGLGTPRRAIISALCGLPLSVMSDNFIAGQQTNQTLSAHLPYALASGTTWTLTSKSAGTVYPQDLEAYTLTANGTPLSLTGVSLVPGGISLTTSGAITAGAAVVLTVRGVTNSTTFGSSTITLSDGGDAFSATTTITQGMSLATSSLSLSTSTVQVGQSSVVTLNAKDSSGVALAGDAVHATVGGLPETAHLLSGTGITDKAGSVQFVVVGDSVGTTTVTVRLGTTQLTSSSLSVYLPWSGIDQGGNGDVDQAARPAVLSATPKSSGGVSLFSATRTVTGHVIVATSSLLTSPTTTTYDLTQLYGVSTTTQVPALAVYGGQLYVLTTSDLLHVTLTACSLLGGALTGCTTSDLTNAGRAPFLSSTPEVVATTISGQRVLVVSGVSSTGSLVRGYGVPSTLRLTAKSSPVQRVSVLASPSGGAVLLAYSPSGVVGVARYTATGSWMPYAPLCGSGLCVADTSHDLDGTFFGGQLYVLYQGTDQKAHIVYQKAAGSGAYTSRTLGSAVGCTVGLGSGSGLTYYATCGALGTSTGLFAVPTNGKLGPVANLTTTYSLPPFSSPVRMAYVKGQLLFEGASVSGDLFQYVNDGVLGARGI